MDLKISFFYRILLDRFLVYCFLIAWSAQIMYEFLEDSARVLSLYDFWIDTSSGASISATFLLDVIRAGTGVAAPIFLSLAVEEITQDNPNGQIITEQLYIWAALLAGNHVLKSINNIIISYMLQTELCNKLLGDKTLARIHSIELSGLETELNQTEIPSLVIRFTEETNLLLSKAVNEFWPLLISLILSMTVLYYPQDSFNVPRLSEGMSALLWLYTVYNLSVCAAVSYCQRDINVKTEEMAGRFVKALTEDISHMPSIRMHNHTSAYLENTRRLFYDFTQRIVVNDTSTDMLKLILIKAPLLAVCLGTISLISGKSISKNEFDELVLVLNYIMLFHGLTSDFALSILDTRKAISHLKKIKNIIQNDRQFPNENIAINTLNPLRIMPNTRISAIEFRQVSLTIGNKAILSNISFNVPLNSSCALVGQSGSGKSSIIKLLCGFYKPTTGTILINGVDISNIPRNHLRELISMVSQDTDLFYSDIQPSNQILTYNLFFSQANSTRLNQLRHGARLDPNEQQRLVTTRTTFLLGQTPDSIPKPSGGEQQRIGLARWSLRDDASIFILDEPTSALDSISESRIIGAINNLMQANPSKVLLMTGHRLKTVEAANLILLMEEGRIVEQGPHNTLMQNNGRYYEYYESQRNTPSFSL